MFDHIRSDLAAHGGHWGAQGFWALLVYRFGRWRYGIRPALLRKSLSLVYKTLYKCVQIITGIELPCEVKVGKNFVIDHFGGIVVSGYASFGDNCRIRNGVVVGLRRVDQGLGVFGEAATAVATPGVQKAVTNAVVSPNAAANLIDIGAEYIGQVGDFIHE